MVGAGWYDDPLVPGGKRWWTGQAWTEETRPPSSGGGWASGDIPAGPAPWVPGGAPRPAVNVVGPDPWALRSVGDWLTRSFQALVSHLPALLSIYCLLPAALAIGGYIALRSVLAEVVVFFDDELSFEGPGLPSLLVAGVALVVIVVGMMAASLGGLHFLATVHAERPDRPPPDPLRSLGVGLGRIPRLLWVGLVLTVGFVVAAAAVGFAFVAVSNAAEAGTVALAAVVSALLAVPLLIWLLVKLAFVQIAVVAAPLGTSVLGASFQVSAGRFWSILGRLALWLIIGWAVSIPIQTVNNLVVTPTLASPFSVESSSRAGDGLNPSDTLLVNGVPFDELESLALDDVLPDLGAALPLLGIGVALNGLVQAVQGSMLTALYVDAERRPRPPRR